MGGRPRKHLPAHGLHIIRGMAENGASEVEIAKALGMNFRTWRRLRDEDPVARDAWAEARGIEEGKLVGKLFQQAIEENNTTAAIFLLKARHGYRDVGPADGGDAGPRVNLTFNLPAPLNGDQYRRLVEVHPEALPAPGEAT